MTNYAETSHWELGRVYNEFMGRYGQIAQALATGRARDRHIIHPDEWDWKVRGQGGQHKSAQHRNADLISAECGFNAFNMHAFSVELAPGESEGAYHVHGEALKFYLKGVGKEIIGDREYDVEAGDVILVPAHVWHGTQNPYPDTVRFLAFAHAGAGAPMFQQPIFHTREDLQEKDPDRTKIPFDLGKHSYTEAEMHALGRARYHLMQELGNVEREMESRRLIQRHLMRQSELEWRDLSEEIGVEQSGPPVRIAKAICPDLEFPARNFLASFIEVPGQATEPVVHRHGEEVKYFMQGRGVETIGDAEFEVGPGDLIFVPANTWHSTRNRSDEPLRFFSVQQARGTPVATPAYLDVR